MKRKALVLLVPLVLFVVIVQAQEGSAVYKRLEKQFDFVVYHKHWGNKYCYGIRQNGFEGCCDKDGNVIVPPTKYTYVDYSKDDNMFRVKIGDKAGLLDEHGKVLVEADKYTAVYWHKGDRMYRVEIGDKAGLLDEHGKVLVEADKYTSVYWLKDDRMYRVEIGDKAGLLDEQGEVLVEADKYTSVYWRKDDRVYSVEIGDKAGLLDEHGKVLVEPVKGSLVSYYDKKSKCYIVEQLDSQYKAIAKTLYSPQGKAIFESKTMKDMGSVSEGMIAIQENDLWGYMDVTNGKMVIPAQYTSADKFENGVAKVSKGNESFLISHPLKGKGSEVLSSLSLGQSVHSDIDDNIFESKRVEENTFAVILSVQNYTGFVVPFATSDGKVFRQYCEKSLGVPSSNFLYYEDATLNNMHAAITRINDLADAYEGDAKIIFYFAGQGMLDKAGNPYLMPSDAALNLIATTGYSVEKLYRELGNLDVKSAIVLLDVGFTNENREGKEITKNDGTSVVRTKNVPVMGKVAALVATSDGESAYVDKDKGHGLFTYFLCKKIKESKGDINLQELFDYVKTSVVNTSKDKMKKNQTPQTISANSIILKNIKL